MLILLLMYFLVYSWRFDELMEPHKSDRKLDFYFKVKEIFTTPEEQFVVQLAPPHKIRH